MLCEKVLPTAKVDCSMNPAAIASERSVVADETDGGTELWLASAPSLPVCSVEFAFDR